MHLLNYLNYMLIFFFVFCLMKVMNNEFVICASFGYLALQYALIFDCITNYIIIIILLANKGVIA